ncbi:murein transglycosylase A [Legionella spiritensis]|uniref:Membrane-bound lytic murein transglycosylase A n=1 Tax=Legionella spiritensis TaxID=452 RepID=A0A0W0Z806_LEGSP|nr:MltA domain-containing protein [Legionella spiritensis]KTD65224.1 Membrane-bound lytic murein transglycosylase [Legionella spiritensis]SNV39594.1 Membrane-bound lytic murein transglycosylase [Legionella spiritensis]VEG90395.1 Membrane-bound lytic murein transglycosylase [Legionella spiritensis]
MKSKRIYIIFGLAILLVGLSLWFARPEPVKLHPILFKQLPGWKEADLKKSLQAFKISCRTFMRQNPDNQAGSHKIPLKVRDWQPACKAALAMDSITDESARSYFQTWFTPVEFRDNRTVKGLFTGYYMPLLQGSIVKTNEYNVPIYALPDNLVSVNLDEFGQDYQHRRLTGRLKGNQLVPYHTRKQINQGAILNHAEVLVWVKSPIDRLFLEIQGSGVVQLPDGRRLYLGYAGENGAAYTPIGSVLIKRGAMTRKTTSMQTIRAYLEEHPEEIETVINQNKSFVFFRILKQSAALGAQGVALTPGYSLAIDRKWIPLGAPLWLNTTRPDEQHQDKQSLRRLMIAQDTGGAIKGIVRGDVFWGAGQNATNIAGKMKNDGHYWLLLPRHTIPHLPELTG